MPEVRMAICAPSRSDQIATSTATSHCRVFGAIPAIGQSALPAPTSPTEKVQMVSTQPELPVRCWTTQANAIRSVSETAIAAAALRYKTVISNEDLRQSSELNQIRSNWNPVSRLVRFPVQWPHPAGGDAETSDRRHP